jgi:type IV pilus assembly protein PilV
MKNNIIVKYFKNTEGVTLVEVMIALVVLLLVFMGLLQAALLSIDHNIRNILRDEAIKIATERMEEARSLPFTQTTDNLLSDANALPGGADCPTTFTFGTGVLRERNVRNITGFDFCTNRTAGRTDGTPGFLDPPANNTKRVTITVGWRWKGEDYTHTATTLRRR